MSCGSDEPVGPAPPARALRFRTIDAGYYHTCALTLDARAYCWGRNDFGTLGDGTRLERARPAAVAGGHAFGSLDAGAGHNCALAATGEAWCWGHNDEGQLGDGSFTTRDQPVRVAGALRFAAISAGHAHSCGLLADGVAYCWGDDSRGQLGDGGAAGAARSASPVRVLSTRPFTAVIAGYYQTCAREAAGGAWCWGANESGQVGDGTILDRHQPVAVTGGRSFSSIAPGDRFVCGISAGTAWCWGANRAGELGSAGGSSALPVRVAGVSGLRSVAASAGTSTVPGAAPYACGITAKPAALCWGGEVRALRPATPQPEPLSNLPPGVLAAGAQHICLLDRRGYAWCGGANYAGQLGDGSHSDRAALVGVQGPPQ